MEFEWVAIALGDIAWIAIAFGFGLLARSIGLPPLVGFLAAGFLLGASGAVSGDMLRKLADLGITLLLFTVGLKLNLRTLARPQVWAVSGLHMLTMVGVFALGMLGLVALGAPLFAGLDLADVALMAFALSFSSTVFAVKVLEEKGEMRSLHGRIAIGILVMQDLAAVVFLALSAGKMPTVWALALLLLIPVRPLLFWVLGRVGHGELLVLYGLLLGLGGAEIFELVGVKGDLGALVAGMLIAGHPRAAEIARTMLGFKDLFLLGFFLSIGLAGAPDPTAMLIGIALAPLILIKGFGFLAFLTAFRLRARTGLLTSLHLMNYSEFGLIVAAVGVSNGWIDAQWLVVLAISVSVTFAVASILNARGDWVYRRYRSTWLRLQRRKRMPDDRLLDAGDATIAVIGMGRVGTGAYDEMLRAHGDTLIGVDSDPLSVRRHQEDGRNVLLGDPSDADFWERFSRRHTLRLLMLSLPNLSMNRAVLTQLDNAGFDGEVAVIARYPDEVPKLLDAGASTVFNIYTEAGTGFAAHVQREAAAAEPTSA